MGMPDISSYAQLRQHFNKMAPFRGTQDRPFGSRKYSNRRMRMLDDESIELEYMGDALVRWHPDGTISVKAYPCKRQGWFDSNALPKQIHVGLGTRVGPIIVLYDTNETDYWIATPIPKA